MNKNQVRDTMLQIRDFAHLCHWETTSFAEHEAMGKFYDAWLDLTDSFIESFMGKYGRMGGGMVFAVREYKEGGCVQCVQEASYLVSMSARTVIAPTDTELHNILDEMVALCDQTLYRLSLG